MEEDYEGAAPRTQGGGAPADVAFVIMEGRTMSENPQDVNQQPVPPEAQDEPPVVQADAPEAKTWAMLCHLGALAGFIGIPFGNIVGPLVFWLIKKDTFPLVDDQGKESLNFQISLTIYGIASAVLIIVLIGFLLLPAVLIFGLVMVIMGSIAANKGERYRYPLCIRFIK